jgi:hypothetical protein
MRWRVADSIDISLDCTDENQEFAMVWQRRVLFVNAAMEVPYLARDVALDARREYNVPDARPTRGSDVERCRMTSGRGRT